MYSFFEVKIMKNNIEKKILNILFVVFIIACFVYGIGSITYANTNEGSINVVEIIINNEGNTIEGNIFGNEYWYPGKEVNGVIRITNNYKKADISNLDLNVTINDFKKGLSQDIVWESFIDNMVLTVRKGVLPVFNHTIVENKTLNELLEEGIQLSKIDTLGVGNSLDLEYTLKMDENAGDELENVTANIDFLIDADEVISKKKKKKNFDGGLIDRMKGYIELAKRTFIDDPDEELNLAYDNELIEDKEEYSARVYYWNEVVEKWVALASYSSFPNEINAINDGGYSGWFNVFGVIQPIFTDIAEHWAEPVTNRMNGLGIVEGYPGAGLVRPAKLEQHITRAEFTTLLYRLLNINPDMPLLENYTLEEAKIILPEYFLDAAEIPDWVACMTASAVKAGLIHTRNEKFEANEFVTRLEAAVMVSNSFKFLARYQPLDLSVFKDIEDIPDWAKAALAENVIEGYPDNTFRPDEFITRAEALTVLKRLFIIGMGL